MAEHLTFNQGVDGSSPSWLTTQCESGGTADTLDSGSSGHYACGGSNPPSRTNKIKASGVLETAGIRCKNGFDNNLTAVYFDWTKLI